MKKYWLIIPFCILLLSSCESLTKEVEVDLPPFESQLIVEAYLMQDRPVLVSVMETKDYFAEIDTPFVDDAKVTFSHDGQADTLISSPFINPFTLKYNNYRSKDTLHMLPGEIYTVTVKDPKGRLATGSATWIEPVKIDSVVYRKPEGVDNYNVLLYFRDPLGKDYYRFRVRRLGLAIVNDTLRQDYFSDDALFDGTQSAFGTGYDFKVGDQLEVTLYHLTEEYYNFLSTVSAASSANGNPFAQPAAIQGNVTGGIGIVTPLSYDRMLITIR